VRRRLLSAVLALSLLGAACSDDGPEPPPADPMPEQDELPGHGDGPDPATGDVEVPEVPDTFPVALPSLGFGIAIPMGWNATRLDDDALERLEDADLREQFFLDAARTVAATGALFYAAGIDDEGRVAEIKVERREGDEADPATARAAAEAAVIEAGGTDLSVVEAEDGRVRLDFRLDQPAADDGRPIDAHVSELLVPDGDRLWSIVVTSEDASTQSAVLAVVDAGFVLAG
jgi:hypothetical protein